MKIARIAVIFLLFIVLVSGLACCGGEESEPTPTATATLTTTPTPLPTVTTSCSEARDAIQGALTVYNTQYQEWPTVDGQPGDIEWTKLVPDFMAGVPSNDSLCDWWVDSSPQGTVCLQNMC